MFSNIAIKVENISKHYQIYDQPRDRLKQFILPRVQRFFRRSPQVYFREFRAINEISFEIKKGETVGIVGRNGSGKSTLLQLICGTLHPSSGSLHTNGRVAALLELGSGFNPDFTGRENVYLNASILGLSHNEINARFSKIAEFADIGEFIDQPIKSYSSGMVVRLAFAVAINVEPNILVIDEALSVGDELFQRKCFSKIEEIRKSGATILFVSHSGSTVVDLCDRAILLEGGELLAAGTPKQIVSNYQKLLYAPDDKREAIRQAIVDISLDKPCAMTATPHSVSEPTINSVEQNEVFDPDFVPQSTVIYESHGALIGDAQIHTISGKPVNGLVRGRNYHFVYQVTFSRPATNVRFAMLIKTASGMPLGGGLSASSTANGIPIVEAGASFSIEYTFTCHLNPGVYFLNAGVFGCAGSQAELVLHRKADVLAFRVLPVAENQATELVDFDLKCRAETNERAV